MKWFLVLALMYRLDPGFGTPDCKAEWYVTYDEWEVKSCEGMFVLDLDDYYQVKMNESKLKRICRKHPDVCVESNEWKIF